MKQYTVNVTVNNKLKNSYNVILKPGDTIKDWIIRNCDLSNTIDYYELPNDPEIDNKHFQDETDRLLKKHYGIGA